MAWFFGSQDRGRACEGALVGACICPDQDSSWTRLSGSQTAATTRGLWTALYAVRITSVTASG